MTGSRQTACVIRLQVLVAVLYRVAVRSDQLKGSTIL